MKRTIFLISFCFSFFCHAQSGFLDKTDSLALESRFKADVVLSTFDTLSGKKLLYSELDRDYYIIIQQDNCFKEYVVTIDDCCYLSFVEVENDKELDLLKKEKHLPRNKRRRLKELLRSRQILKDGFNTDQYSKGFIISIPNASIVEGVPSYFVIKDENNQRFGEYSLSSITSPSPINPQLWAYLVRQLSDMKYAQSLVYDKN